MIKRLSETWKQEKQSKGKSPQLTLRRTRSNHMTSILEKSSSAAVVITDVQSPSDDCIVSPPNQGRGKGRKKKKQQPSVLGLSSLDWGVTESFITAVEKQEKKIAVTKLQKKSTTIKADSNTRQSFLTPVPSKIIKKSTKNESNIASTSQAKVKKQSKSTTYVNDIKTSPVLVEIKDAFSDHKKDTSVTSLTKTVLKQTNKVINNNNISSNIRISSPVPNQQLKLSAWGLPDSVLQQYASNGIDQMFPWQLECLLTGNALEGGNLVYSAPTSAGKTLVAEVLMLKRVLENKKKAIFILPFVSVAREKMYSLRNLVEEAGVKVGGFMGSESPPGGLSSVDIAICTIEKANSIINRLMEEKKTSNLCCVVVDEMHLIGDPHRGYLLELTLTKLKYLSSLNDKQAEKNTKHVDIVPSLIQIIGMSATLPNLKMIADWLNACLYVTTYRPVPLQELIKIGNSIIDNSGKQVSSLDSVNQTKGDEEGVIPLCLQTLVEGKSVLIFCPTKNWCEKLSETVARYLSSNTVYISNEEEHRNVLDHEKLEDVLEQLRRCPVGLDRTVEKVVKFGVAFHHAGLTYDERDIIEGSFRRGILKVLVATSTLSSGVNLPARRVIIRSPTFHGKLIDSLVYKQMSGRAGRKGVDSMGESVLICKPSEKQKCLSLLTAPLKAVYSCLLGTSLSDNKSMKRAILEIIAGGVAISPSDVERYCRSSYFHTCLSLKEHGNEDEAIKSTVGFLIENEFITLQKKQKDGVENEEVYFASQLGVATLASSLSPDEALLVFQELQQARKSFVLECELHMIYQVTPIFLQDQWPDIDWNTYFNIWERMPPIYKLVAERVGVTEMFLVKAVRNRIQTKTEEQKRTLRIHRRFYGALVLLELVNEVPLPRISKHFGINRGLLQSLQNSASTFAGMVTVFCQKLGWSGMELLLEQFQSRLSFGVSRELCNLVRIPLLNAFKARVLYENGYQTVSTLAHAHRDAIAKILRDSVPFESKHNNNKKASLSRCIWLNGKEGLTETEAADLVINEAIRIINADAISLGLPAIKLNHPRLENNKPIEKPNAIENNNPIEKHYAIENNNPIEKHYAIEKSNPIEKPYTIEKPYASEKTGTDEFIGEKQILRDNLSCKNVPIKISQNVPSKDSTDYASKDSRSDKNSPPHENLAGKGTKQASSSERKRRRSRISITNVEKSVNASVNTSTTNTAVVTHFKSPKIMFETLNKISDSIKTSNGNKSLDKHLKVREDENEIRKETFYKSKNSKIPKMQPHSNLIGLSSKIDSIMSPIAGSTTLKRMNKEHKPSDIKQSLKTAKTSPIESIKQNIVTPNCSVELIDIGSANNSFDLIDSVNSSKHSLHSDNSPNHSLPADNSPKHNLPADNSSKHEENNEENVIIIASPPPLDFSLRLSESYDNLFVSPLNLGSQFDECSVVAKLPSKKNSLKSIQSRESVEKFFADSFNFSESILPTSKRKESSNDSLTSDEFVIIDVTTNNELFSTFLEELKYQKKTSLCFAYERVQKTQNVIGGNMKSKITQTENTRKCAYENNDFCVVGIAFCWENKDSYYVNLEEWNVAVNNPQILDEELSTLKLSYRIKCLTDIVKSLENMEILGSDMKTQLKAFYFIFDSMLENHIIVDPKVAQWLLNPDESIKTLKELVHVYLKDETVAIAQAVGETFGRKENDVPVNITCTARTRACVEAVLVLELMGVLEERLSKESLYAPFLELEMKSLRTLAVIEINGIGISDTKCDSLKAKMKCKLQSIEKECFQLASRTFSLASTHDIAKVLFFELGLPPNGEVEQNGRQTRSKSARKLKNLSTSKKILEKLIKLHRLPKLILEWRRVNSSLTKVTYPIQRKKEHVQCFDMDRVFSEAHFHTSTGRVTFTEPNLQNIPKIFDIKLISTNDKFQNNCEQNLEIASPGMPCEINMREIIVAHESSIFIGADYSQLELRIIAHLAKDEKLIKVLNSNCDVFKTIAAETNRISVDEVSKVQRQVAKQICYGILYGIGAKSLSEQLQVDEDEATKFMEQFKDRYTGVKKFIQKTIEEARSNGFVTTLCNRKRYLPNIISTNPATRSQAERQAVNTTVQGSAADLVKTAMISINKKLCLKYGRTCYLDNNEVAPSHNRRASSVNPGALLVLQIHDELLYEVKVKEEDFVKRLIKHEMENALNLSVEMPVKLQRGKSWGTLIEISL